MGRRPVNVGAPPIGVPFAPELPTGLDTGAVQLIAVDFGKICDVYLFQINERAEATKLFITLASAPFIILSAFGITDIITFVNAEENRPKTILEILSSLPNFMYLFLFSRRSNRLYPLPSFCCRTLPSIQDDALYE